VPWLQEFQILPGGAKRSYRLAPDELGALWIKLAEKYNKAASFHAQLLLASQQLEALIEEKEGEHILRQLHKYKMGGEMWDANAKKLMERRPSKEALALEAREGTKELRLTLRRIKMEVEFFANIMANLETQRRCFKDYAEIFAFERQSMTFAGG
jgi:transcriptional antiterminator Rof (Rho-off)